MPIKALAILLLYYAAVVASAAAVRCNWAGAEDSCWGNTADWDSDSSMPMVADTALFSGSDPVAVDLGGQNAAFGDGGSSLHFGQIADVNVADSAGGGLLVIDANDQNTAKLPSARPNIIYILTDDHGYTDLGILGIDPRLRTPNMDALAGNGVLFTSGYATAPQCRPSRAGVMTGRYQNRFGYKHNEDEQLPLVDLEGQPIMTIAERIRDEGYRTGMVGKWHLSPNASTPDESFPGNREDYNAGSRGFTDYFEGALRGYAINFWLDGTDREHVRHRFPDGTHRIDVQTDASIAFIDRAMAAGEPFFLYLGYYAPHSPREQDAHYYANFPEVDDPRFAALPTAERAAYNDLRRQGLAIIEAMDVGIGRIMERLRYHGIDEDTLIVFAGDNGSALKMTDEGLPGLPMVDRKPSLDTSILGSGWIGSDNQPLRGEKGSIWEGGVRVPMFAYWKKGLPAGLVYTHPVSTLDLSAMAVESAGAALPAEGYDGVNLAPYLNAEPVAAPDRPIFWNYGIPSYGFSVNVRYGKWKLRKFADRVFLFDMENDPQENSDLSKAMPKRVAELEPLADAFYNSLPPAGRAVPGPYRSQKRGLIYLDGYEDRVAPVEFTVFENSTGEGMSDLDE